MSKEEGESGSTRRSSCPGQSSSSLTSTAKKKRSSRSPFGRLSSDANASIAAPRRLQARKSANATKKASQKGKVGSQLAKANCRRSIEKKEAAEKWKDDKKSFLTALSVAAVAPSRARELTARVARTGARRRAATRNIVSVVFEERKKKEEEGRRTQLMLSEDHL